MATAEELKYRGFVAQLEAALGSEICAALADHDVVEVMAQESGEVLVEKHGSGIEHLTTIKPAQAGMILSLVASHMGTTITTSQPIVSGSLPVEFGGGARIEGLIPPCVSAPVFAIRVKARAVYTLAQYVTAGIMTAGQREQLEQAVLEHKNVLVSGGTGSGKTTLLNALLHVISQNAGLDDRVVTIEDTLELQCSAPNYVALRTSDMAGVSMTTLLKSTMRLRPNRIIVGEVRDGAALALLKAWNTGHPGGLATVHANSPQAALLRLDQLCQEAGVQSQATLIQEAVDVVVQISRGGPAGRSITGLLDVKAQK